MPVLSIASAEIVESQVTKPLEDSLAGIEGVDVLSSISRQERSQITVRFRVERDADSAAAERERLCADAQFQAERRAAEQRLSEALNGAAGDDEEEAEETSDDGEEDSEEEEEE